MYLWNSWLFRPPPVVPGRSPSDEVTVPTSPLVGEVAAERRVGGEASTVVKAHPPPGESSRRSLADLPHKGGGGERGWLVPQISVLIPARNEESAIGACLGSVLASKGIELEVVVERLNPVIRGWGNYFRSGNSARKFSHIDSDVHERLAILASNKHKRSGRNWGTRFNSEWLERLDVYTLTGTVRYGTANAPR